MAPDTNLSDFTVLLRGLGDSLKDLIMFTPRRQRGSNPCAVNNGGCAELCLYNGTHPVCACAHGMVAPDGKSCKGLCLHFNLTWLSINTTESYNFPKFYLCVF